MSLLLNGCVTAGATGVLAFVGSRGGKAGALRGGSVNGAAGRVDWVEGGKVLVLNDCMGDEGMLSATEFLGLNSNSSSSEPLGLKSSSEISYGIKGRNFHYFGM